MNVPFFSKYGTKYAPASSPSAATDLDTVDPETQDHSYLKVSKQLQQLQVTTMAHAKTMVLHLTLQTHVD